MVPNSTKVADEEKKFRDCADLYQAGVHKNGVYTIQINPQETKKVWNQNILEPAVHRGVKMSAFSSLLVCSLIVGLQAFACFLFAPRKLKRPPKPPLGRWVWMVGACCWGLWGVKQTWNRTLSRSAWWQLCLCVFVCVFACVLNLDTMLILLIDVSDDHHLLFLLFQQRQL